MHPPPTKAIAGLAPHHYALLHEASAIPDHVIAARGYRTFTEHSQLRHFGQLRQRRVPCLGLPWCWPVPVLGTEWKTGRVGWELRPDLPRPAPHKRTGKVVKYEWPAGKGKVLDCNPLVWEQLKGRGPLLITEGIRKADAAVGAGYACLAMAGVRCWARGANRAGTPYPLPQWRDVDLVARRVWVILDSDMWANHQAWRGINELQKYLDERGAIVQTKFVPGGGGEKVGLDDYLAAGGQVEALL